MSSEQEESNDFIQCYGFCGDPAALRLNAMTLMSIVNSGEKIESFISTNYRDYLNQDLLDPNKDLDVLEQWTLDCREQIVNLATGVALGCRRLFDSLDGNNWEYDTVIVGEILNSSRHDRNISHSQLSFINACSRLIHANKWSIKKSCSSSQTPSPALVVETDSSGKYEICLSGFSFAAWVMTKSFSYKENNSQFIANIPALRY